MNKQELIKKIETLPNILVFANSSEAPEIYVLLKDVLELTKQLDEPQTENVEITERQERLLKKYEDEPFHRLLNNCRTDEEDLLARARLNGYTVKSKRFKVCVDGRTLKHLQFYKDSKWVSFFENGTPMTFTDRAKADAVATLIDGEVEEV